MFCIDIYSINIQYAFMVCDFSILTTNYIELKHLKSSIVITMNIFITYLYIIDTIVMYDFCEFVIVAIILGGWNCLSILMGSVDCLISGMWQMVAGFIVATIEAPCCCLFIDYVQNLSDWVEKRPYWNRAAGYCM